jgi:transcriptional regulator with PAS, ATPase and Fis domain
LARHFIRHFTTDEEKPPEIDDAVLEYLKDREYPGNVRDLKHLIYRIMCRHAGRGPVTTGDIPETDRPSSVIIDKEEHLQLLEVAVRRALSRGIGLKDIGKAAEDIAISIALQGDGSGKSARAAQKLGVTERTIQKRLKEGITSARDIRPDSSG